MSKFNINLKIVTNKLFPNQIKRNLTLRSLRKNLQTKRARIQPEKANQSIKEIKIKTNLIKEVLKLNKKIK